MFCGGDIYLVWRHKAARSWQFVRKGCLNIAYFFAIS